MIEVCDSHIHIGDYNELSDILENSIYKDKYKVYSCIKKEVLLEQKEYLSTLKDFFAIPHVFKESNIQKNNKYVLDFCKNNKKGVPVLVVDDNSYFTDDYETCIFKEHFLKNKYEDRNNRSLFYDYLSNQEGYLLIHCKDNIRIEYINYLINNYNNMNIIIAHLGRDKYENYSFINNVLEEFKSNEKVFFDVSTIHNIDNIKNAINKVGNERILYGSDFPFEVDSYKEFNNSVEKIINTFDDTSSEKILSKNFERIREKVYVRK